MRSVLDEHGGRWFLTSLTHEPPRVVLTLAQAVRGDEMPFIDGPSGPIPTPGRRRLEISAESRRAAVVFEEVVAYQVIDDAFTRLDERETVDDRRHVIQVVSGSQFLRQLPGEPFRPPWDLAEPRMVRVLTTNAVIEVVGRGLPEVRPAGGT